MFLGWIYEYVFAVIVSAIALLYNVYCFIGLIMYNKNKNAITAKFNSYIWLAKKMAGKQSNNEKKLKKYSKLLRKVNIGVIVLMTSILIMNIVLLSIIYMLNIQATNISNILTTLFGKSDCSCYAKCTGDEEDDAKTAYELLFGPTEYDKFTEAVMKDMLPSDAQPFVDMIANEANGKEQGEWLIAHLNDDAVQCYKEIVGDNNKFRAGDHQDRSKMTNGELKDDLIALLKDYKVGGRNPNCERCFDVEDHQLATKCIGEAHWVPGWTWEAIWDSDNPGDGSEEEPGDNSGGNVAAKDSQYGIELDGEWYYWYHQKAEGCVNDVKHDTYGHYGSLWIVSGTAAARGCSSYSSAMAISNAVGAEVTPYVLLEDIMGGTFSQGSSGWQFNNNATQYIDYKENAINMKKDALSKRVEEWCHSKGYTGIHTEYIPNPSQAKIDEVLSKGGYIVASWFHDTSNGIAWYPKLSSGSGSHFMVIRKKDANGLYYCLNSAEGHDHTRSKAGITYSEMASTMYNTTWWGWAIWNDNPPSTNPGDGNGDGGDGGGGGGGVIEPPSDISDPDILEDIKKGLYTEEDYNYLVALGGESSSYEGFYAVACSVRNRVNNKGTSYKAEVTAPNQFAGYNQSEVGNPRNNDVKRAAVAVLRGGPSTVGNCVFFFGRRSGHDMWAESSCPEFYNVGGNIYYQSWGQLHNTGTYSGNGILIWKSSEQKWYYPSGTYYKK